MSHKVEFRAKSIRKDMERKIKGTHGDNSQRRYRCYAFLCTQ